MRFGVEPQTEGVRILVLESTSGLQDWEGCRNFTI